MKKITAVLLSILMLLVPLSVMAEEIKNPDFMLEVKNANAELVEGETVRVEVKASSNRGYAYASAKVEWDSEALELTGVEYTDAAPDNKSSAIKNSGEYTVRFGSNRATENFTKTGTFFTLLFKITDKAEIKSYDITIGELSVFDADDNAVDSYSIAGKVNFSAFTEEGLVLAASDVSGKVSDTEIKVPVNASKNDGFKTASIFVSWDASAFTLSNIEYGEIPDGGSAAGESAGSYLVKLGKAAASADYTADGTLFTLVFKPVADAKTAVYPVTLAAAFANKKNGSRVKTDLTSGSVTLVDDRELYVETYVRPTDAPEETGAEDTTPVDDPDNFGTVGDCTWSFDPATGTLTISGSGIMSDFAGAASVPYAKHAANIKKVVVAEGVTSIGDFCFAGLSALKEVSMTSSVTRIGVSAFEDSAIDTITIPSSVTEIGENAIGYKTNGVDEAGDPVHEKSGDVLIECEDDSAALEYANSNGLRFLLVEPAECAHTDLSEDVRLPDISTGADGYQKLYCTKCGKVMAEVTLTCPVITLSKTKYTYNGKTCKPAVTVLYDGEVVPAKDSAGSVNYTVKYTSNKDAGTGKVTVTMALDSVATGSKTLTFTISKAKNPMTVKVASKTFKAKDAKKKNVTIKKAITVKKNQGKVTYKAAKGASKGVSISKTGVITIKKGKYKKNATLKITVNVTAAGSKNYNKLTKKVTVKIKVK